MKVLFISDIHCIIFRFDKRVIDLDDLYKMEATFKRPSESRHTKYSWSVYREIDKIILSETSREAIRFTLSNVRIWVYN